MESNHIGLNVIKDMSRCLIQEGLYLLEKANIRKINTIYFGGGTPSLMEPKMVQVKIIIL